MFLCIFAASRNASVYLFIYLCYIEYLWKLVLQQGGKQFSQWDQTEKTMCFNEAFKKIALFQSSY